MKSYKYRGSGILIGAGCLALFGLIMFLAFEKARVYGIVMMGMSLLYLPAFGFYRKMTPEQFAKRQKDERVNLDERNMQIAYRACRIAAISGFFSLTAGTVFFAFIHPNMVAFWATFGYILVMVIALLAARSILKRKI